MDSLDPVSSLEDRLNSSPVSSIVTHTNRPSREEALKAVRTLLAWAGDDPDREGLKDTPKRVVEAYDEWFAGYTADPAKELSRTFEDVQGYDDMVMLRDIDVESHCEHHMAAFLGKAYVAYMPTDKVVGISKIARVVEIFSKRLQTQETLTKQITDAIEASLNPAGVAVLIDAEHQCMTTRGVHHKHVSTITTRFTGAFKTDQALQDRFMRLTQK
jgi:GTP cyclohydrolase I